MKYKFTKSGRSYATGQTWAKGQVVPDSFSIGLVETMLADGTIVEVTPEPIQSEKEMVIENEISEPAVETNPYSDLLSKELTEILEERGLPSNGKKEEKIARLIEADKKQEPEPIEEAEDA